MMPDTAAHAAPQTLAEQMADTGETLCARSYAELMRLLERVSDLDLRLLLIKAAIDYGCAEFCDGIYRGSACWERAFVSPRAA